MKALAEADMAAMCPARDRFHPRVYPAFGAAPVEMVEAAAAVGAVSGRFRPIGRALEAQLAAEKGRPCPHEY